MRLKIANQSGATVLLGGGSASASQLQLHKFVVMRMLLARMDSFRLANQIKLDPRSPDIIIQIQQTTYV